MKYYGEVSDSMRNADTLARFSTVYTELSTGRKRQSCYTICKIDEKQPINSQNIPEKEEYFRAKRESYQPFAQTYPQTVQNLSDDGKSRKDRK